MTTMNKLMWMLTLCSIFSFTFCKSSKYTPADYPDSQIRFGNGGGFTGQVTETCLLDNGTLFTGTGLQTKVYEKSGRIKKTIADQLFQNFQILNLGEVEYHHPGNIYHYIELKEGNGSTHRITWGDDKHKVPQKVKLFYDLLNHHIISKQ